jgi:hypothetical protein
MARYYKKHICEECGCYCKAFAAKTKLCPECMGDLTHNCLKCGKEFKARWPESHYCDKHKYLQSPAYLANQEQHKLDMIARRQEINRRYREKQAAKVPGKPGRPRTRPEKPEKKKVITSTPIMESRPMEIIIAKLPVKPVEKFFLTIGKARYGFTTQERLDEFKRQKGIA